MPVILAEIQGLLELWQTSMLVQCRDMWSIGHMHAVLEMPGTLLNCCLCIKSDRLTFERPCTFFFSTAAATCWAAAASSSCSLITCSPIPLSHHLIVPLSVLNQGIMGTQYHMQLRDPYARCAAAVQLWNARRTCQESFACLSTVTCLCRHWLQKPSSFCIANATFPACT